MTNPGGTAAPETPPPQRNQAVGTPVGECPRKQKVFLGVTVVAPGKESLTEPARVTIAGPTSGEKATDDSSTAEFSDISPGSYKITVALPGPMVDDGYGFADAHFEPGKGYELDLEPRDTGWVFVQVTAPPSLEVVVVGSDGEPKLEAVKVEVKGPKTTSGDTQAGTGAVRFPRLPQGTYTLTLTLPEALAKKYALPSTAPDVTLVPGATQTAKVTVPIRVNPKIELEAGKKPVVLVKRAYTTPARLAVTLKAEPAFDGSGTFTVAGDRVRFFRDGATEAVKFDGTDNVFTGVDLTAGVKLLAEGAAASAALDDVLLTLTLTGGTASIGPDAKAKVTSVEVTLDVCEPRVSPSADPAVLPAPPATAPPSGTAATDKYYLGRALPLEDGTDTGERATLIVRQVKPAAFTGSLVLRPLDDKVKAFAAETPSSGETPLAKRHLMATGSIPATGLKLFAEGAAESGAVRDTGFQLGIDGLEDDGDRVAMTVVYAEIVSNVKAADLKAVAIVPEKPARTTRSDYTPPPLIVGKDYKVQLRPFVEHAVPSAWRWSSASTKVSLTDAAKEVLKLKATALSGAKADIEIAVIVTTDGGKFKKRHKLTAVKVEMNSVIFGDRLKATDDINVIKNPSGLVILSGGDAGDVKKVPKLEITKIEPNLTWTDDDDRIAWWIIGGETAGVGKYDGKADFLNDEKAKRGTKIQVFGTEAGDVLIQPYSGGYGYGMFRAHVVPLKQVKYRVNRIWCNPLIGSKREPTASHADAKKHIKVVNIYLRPAGVELIPDDSAEMASKSGNNKVGLSTLDKKVVSVTQDSDGHFDVRVNDRSLTFGATSSDAKKAIRVNARNEIISFAYIHTRDSDSALATALLCPANHAPQARADPPRAYTKADYTLKDKGVPSSSLIPKTGIPPNEPANERKMIVLFPDVSWQGSSPATRDENLLWGVVVPTKTIDGSSSATGGDATILAYANTLAHEVGHVLGLGHRGDLSAGVPDGLDQPTDENLMHPNNPPPTAQNLDILQVKAIRFSEVMFRNP